MNGYMKAIIIWLLIGAIDSIMMVTMSPEWTYFSLTILITLWIGVSLVVRTSSLFKNKPIIKWIVWSLILTLPWAISFAELGMMELVIMMPIFSVIYGVIIGFLNNKCK